MLPLSISNVHTMSRPSIHFLQLLLLSTLLLPLLFLHNGGDAVQYKVGGNDSWGVPPPSDPFLYYRWSQSNHFHVGDSLLFLYPPSEESVIQVTERAFNVCSLMEPLMKFDDGSSVFNLTVPGRFYFTSGVPGHCQKLQRLAVVVPSTANGSTFFPPFVAESPLSPYTAAPVGGPSYPHALGPSVAQKSSVPPAEAAARVSMVGGCILVLFYVGPFAL